MLTDKSNKIFSILKNTSDSLILKKGNQKFIRKTFVLNQQVLKHLVQRQNIVHPNLIGVYHIEYSHNISQQKLAFEIVYEHYCHTLQQFISRQNSSWQDEQLINTIEPIIEVIEHLITKKINLKNFSFKNVVITQSQQIKYIDSFLFETEIVDKEILIGVNNFNQTKIYQNVAEVIFNTLHPKQNSKSWKNRLKIVKERSTKAMYMFLSELLSKSLSKGYDISKKKKIRKTISSKKKQNIQDVINKIQKQQKNNQKEYSENYPLCNKHQGKQNKLQQ